MERRRRPPLVRAPALVVALVAACGGGEADPALAPDAGPAPAIDPCSPDAPPPVANASRSLDHQGRTRDFQLHVPPGYVGSPTPLVLDFHGFGSNGTQQAFLSKITEQADVAGFIVVHPEGTGSPQGWNAGVCCGEAAAQGVDDVGFTAAVIDAVEAELCVDPQRVYATGLSNGAFLSHRLACELSDRIAAVAPVAGVLGVDGCAPARPVPVLQIHGTADALVPFEGGHPAGFPTVTFRSVPDTIAAWVAIDGCTGAPVETFAQGDSRCETYQACSAGAEVTLCAVDGGGHTWPGGVDLPAAFGKTTHDLDADAAMWAFFEAHPLP